jgi:hypothetical protein
MRRTFLLLAWLLVPAAATAQGRSETGPVRLNFNLVGGYAPTVDFSVPHGQWVLENGERAASGVGVGLSLGLVFTPRIQLLASIGGSEHDPPGAEAFSLLHLELLLRYSFASSSRRLVPFVSAGRSSRSLIWDNWQGGAEDLIVTGAALTGSAGLSYFLNPSLALESELIVSRGRFTEAQRGKYEITPAWYSRQPHLEPFDATITRLLAGISWYPRGRKSAAAAKP